MHVFPTCFLKDLFLLYVCRYLPACMSVKHVSSWCPRTPEEGIRSLKLVLLIVVSYHVGAGIELGSFSRAANASYWISSAPILA